MKSISCEAKRNVMEIPFVYINFFFFFFQIEKKFFTSHCASCDVILI